MRVFVASTPEELEPYRRAVGDLVRELGMELLARDPEGLPGLRPVQACLRQVAAADLVLTLLGHRRGEVPSPEQGGDGVHPWSWWETRAAFERGLGVEVFLATDSWRPELREPTANGRAVLRDLRGELGRLGIDFDGQPGEEFRRLVHGRLQARQASSPPASEAETEAHPALRRWPSPKLPAWPYPVLLPYTHPDLLTGRDRELARLHQLLSRPVPILGVHAPSGTGKSSLLYGGLVQQLRAEGRPIAFDRHPSEPGLARRLLGHLLAEEVELDDLDAHGFVDQLGVCPEPPILVLDQFEDLLRRADGARARAVVGPLLAASAQRQAGRRGPPCRWLLAYRQEFHGQVFEWLSDVLKEARQAASKTQATDIPLPHDLASADRFHSWSLPPFGAPPAGVGDVAEAAAEVFLNAIQRPLELTEDSGTQIYPWRFAAGSAERLARAFGEARAEQRRAPLVPEFQVVLAHLLSTASSPGGDGVPRVEVPEDPGQWIDPALQEHVQRALDTAFPAGTEKPSRIARTRALLALRELASLVHAGVGTEARSGEERAAGRSAETLARVIGHGGQEVLDQLATPQTRLVRLERRGEDQIYVLSHDRLAEVIVHLVDDERTYASLGVDAELLRLRRFVALQLELFEAGEEEPATVVPAAHFPAIERHAAALLWDERSRRWWKTCRQRRREERRRFGIQRGLAALVTAFLVLGVWHWADRRADRQTLIDQIVSADAPTSLALLAQLTAARDVDAEELRSWVRRRPKPFDVLDRGLGGVREAERGQAVLRVVELLLPLIEEQPEDPERIAPTVWALDFFVGAKPALRARAGQFRKAALAELRRRYPPPQTPAFGDSDWVEIPAGSFLMGTGPGEGRDLEDLMDERPRHTVELSSFRLMAHEVTCGEARRLFPEVEGADQLPAGRLTWYEAYTYAAWIGGRLPTEAEWEYAARLGCAYPYCKRDGTEARLDEVAWWKGNAIDPQTGKPTSQPVRQLEPSPLGFYDIFGNLHEMTADWYGPYRRQLEVDPSGPVLSEHGLRTARGGSFRYAAESIAARARGGLKAEDRYYSFGLRVALPEPNLGAGID